jgi:predicted O-linked N-acetylglucosamine transferase (SPINDLY family)
MNTDLSRQWLSAGCAEFSRREYLLAVESFRKALEIRPDCLETRYQLGRAVFYLGQVDDALDQFRQVAAAGETKGQGPIALIMPGSLRCDNQAVLDARRTWAEQRFPSILKEEACHPSRPADRILRIGYVSSFFQHHNWMKPVWALINHHNRGEFEVHLFSDAPASKIQYGYRAHPQDQFHDTTGLSNDTLVQLIKDAQIDLLVDLNGYSNTLRLPLFAMRPCNVVVGWFNMFATTGIASFDYLVGDDVVIPAEEERFYCEKIVRVPGSYLTFEVTYPVPEVADPPCMERGTITFGSLAPQYKITAEVISTWSSILQRVPNSSLFLKNRALASSATQQFVLGLFEQHQISPDRIRLEGPSDHYEFLKRYDQIDIALDTFPYNGGTTSTEAIWQGVPLVTFRGDRWVSRTSASILQAGTLGDLVASGLEDYVSLAVTSANNRDRLVMLRRNMRSRLSNSPVCDAQSFARNMERLYSQMVSGEIPAKVQATN